MVLQTRLAHVDPPLSAEAMQRIESQRGAMTCSVWCLESSTSSRWPPLVPTQRVAPLCTSRDLTLAQEGAASVSSAASIPCLPLRAETCLQGKESLTLYWCWCQMRNTRKFKHQATDYNGREYMHFLLCIWGTTVSILISFSTLTDLFVSPLTMWMCEVYCICISAQYYIQGTPMRHEKLIYSLTK